VLKNLVLPLLLFSPLLASPAVADEPVRSSVVIFAPVAGWTTNEADYMAGPPGRQSKKTLKEDGALGGIFLMYADDDLSVGNLGHYSNLEQSQVMSYMFFVRYYLARIGTFRPMVGLTADYIDIHSSIPREDARPFFSIDMVNTVWAFQPAIGVSWEYKSFRAVPFVGYFNERVNVDLYSPGMPGMAKGAPPQPGFRTEVSETLDYVSLGSHLEFRYSHFLRYDGKFYFRMREGENALFTVRNRLDLLLARTYGISVRADYFQDKVESNFFAVAGPVLVF